MTIVKQGRYTAKVVGHHIGETKNGDYQAVVKFGFETSDGHKELNWFGSFKPKALEYTLKALIVCGLKGSNPAGELDIGKEVSIVVEVEPDQSGKERNVVRWVNSLTSAKSVNKTEATAALEQYSGALAKLRESSGGSEPDDWGF